nr:MAG TPA: hypothetical protein [Caudoviricetes sp.]
MHKVVLHTPPFIFKKEIIFLFISLPPIIINI